MKAFFTEAEYEELIIELFESLGYEHRLGYDTEHEASSPLYLPELEAQLRLINRGVPQAALDEALRKVRHVEGGSLADRNELFGERLVEGVPASYRDKGELRTALVRLIDCEQPDNNSFIVANQWTPTENSTKRPDIIIFVNGLPLVVMELKSPSAEDAGTHEAYLQLRNYMTRDIPSLFVYNAFCVTSDMVETKAGTISSREDRFMEWKSTDGTYSPERHASYDTFFRGIFPKARLLDIIRNFICFSGNEERVKIMAGYHQYFAVRKAVESTLKASAQGGSGKGGVFWHTQGSGKSLSMVFFAHLLQEAMQSPTLVVLTDRNDLDNQLYAQFAKCARFLRQTPHQAESREDLRQLLQDRQVNGIFFTTMQKFTEDQKPLSERRNIVVIADEAHRSQYGLAERLAVTKDDSGEMVQRLIVGAARRVRQSLPNATYIGFTGTPIAQKDKSTREVFGDYIDIYDMTQSVADGATRPIYYESRVMALKLDGDTLKKIDALYESLKDEAESGAIEQSKRELAQMEAILGNGQTIDTLVRDIIGHYEKNRAELLTGKAMIVAYSRAIAVKIYRKILQLRPEWQEKVVVVMTGSNQDPEDWHGLTGTKRQRDELALKFKDDEGPLKIAIVVDMWLTGFDVPSLATMYVYKPMQGHNLMQAIARVNRVFADKEGGLVVDYIGIAQALKAAMRDYTKRDQTNYGEMDIAKTAYKTFQEKLSVCRDKLHGCTLPDFAQGEIAQKADLLMSAFDFLSRPDKTETREDFLKQALLLRQALSLCSSIAQKEERLEAAFYEAVRTYLAKLLNRGGSKKLSVREINEQVAELLKQSVLSGGVQSLSDAGTQFSIFDPDCLEQIAKMKHKNLAVELLRRLLAEQVKLHKSTNVVKAELFSERLQGFMNAYLNGLISNAQVIEELLKMAEEMRQAQKEGEELGLTTEEKAFYDALTKPQAVRDFYENDELIAITRELTDTLRRNRTIDWQLREDARSKMRMMIKRLLKKHKYPPEGEEEALDTVMRQCEVWADNEED